MPDITVDLRFDAILNGIDDPLICLVRDDQVQVVDMNSPPLANTCQATDHRSDCFGEDFASLHLDETIMTEWYREGTAIFSLGREFWAMELGR